MSLAEMRKDHKSLCETVGGFSLSLWGRLIPGADRQCGSVFL